MKISAYFTVGEVDPSDVTDATVVVIDAVRATTTIVEALANGARAIYPTTSTEDAVKLAQSLGREDTLLCGERRGEKIEGFDLGNSPSEYSREEVEDKRIVMSTTNGTSAFAIGQEGARLLACAFTNLGAVARAVAETEELVVLCAGREDRFALDDALCAGHLIQAVLDDVEGEHELNDAAEAARRLAGKSKPSRKSLEGTASGRALVAIGLADDLEICAEVDRHDIVVEMRDQAITRAGD